MPVAEVNQTSSDGAVLTSHRSLPAERMMDMKFPNSRVAFAAAEHRLARTVAVNDPQSPAWASDDTYLPKLAGGLYMAIVFDVASRRGLS